MALEALQILEPDLNSSTDLDAPNNQGQICEIRAFESRFNWKGEKVLLNAGKVVAYDQSQPRVIESALVLTKFYTTWNALQRMELQIQSPYLIHAFEQVVPEFRNTHTRRDQIILPDFCYFFHYRTELRDFGSSSGNEKMCEHILFALTYMYKALERELQIYYHWVEAAQSTPRIDHCNLWMVFRPGSYMYINRPGFEMVYKISEVPTIKKSSGQKEWSIKGESITYDGDGFGYTWRFPTISYYDGFQILTGLRVIPLDYHPEKDSIIQRITSRGRKFVALCGVHHREYHGTADLDSEEDEDEDDCLQATQVHGRIMLDGKAFYKHRDWALLTHHKKITKVGRAEDLNSEDEHYLLLPQDMPGFSLTEKKWCLFNVDCISDVDHNSRAYENLKLEQKYKQMMLSLVKAHTMLGKDFDDIIKRKGKGLIFLLHGAPGVGKTLTAESVADYCKRPLYILDTGDFGESPSSVAKALKRAFHLAESWGAIILIDEADVFLERRQSRDLSRNGLVSVFLRALEYYQGILFLTTNRVGCFDEAFKSRIHLAIKYPSLSPKFRKELWQTFFSSYCKESDLGWLDETTLNELADEDLNGRQIKNIAQTACTFALGESRSLTFGHVEMAMRAIQAFDSDFAEEKGLKRPQEDRIVPDRMSKRRMSSTSVSTTEDIDSGL